MTCAAPAPGVAPAGARARPYAPRRPQASPLYRLLADHFETLARVHEERYEPAHGPLRAVVAEVVGRFLDCGLLEHGFARVRCGACRAEFLVAFRCKGRGFCPSCQARRVAEWSLWLDEQLLATVPHRHVVLTVPKRLRPYFLYDRRRLGLLSRTAYRTLRAYVDAALGERDAVPGVVSLAQIHVRWGQTQPLATGDATAAPGGRESAWAAVGKGLCCAGGGSESLPLIA